MDRYGHRFPDDLDAVADAVDAAAATAYRLRTGHRPKPVVVPKNAP